MSLDRRPAEPLSDVKEKVADETENHFAGKATKFGARRKRVVAADGVYWTMVASGAAFAFGAAWMFYMIVRRR